MYKCTKHGKVHSVFTKNVGEGIVVISEDAYNTYSVPITTIDWTDPHLVETFEALGAAANGRFSQLCLIDIPNDVNWQIEQYDGLEWVAEVHRTWGKE